MNDGFHSKRVLSERPPRINVDSLLDDGGILHGDNEFGLEYEIAMRELVHIYEDKIAVSAAGDLTLSTDSPEINQREDEVIGRLRSLYQEVRNQEGGAEASLEKRVQAVKQAAEELKPTYDAWEKAHIPDLEGR